GEPVADGYAQRMRNQSIEMVLPLDDRGDPILAVLHHEVESRLEAARTSFASNLRDGSTGQPGIFRPAHLDDELVVPIADPRLDIRAVQEGDQPGAGTWIPDAGDRRGMAAVACPAWQGLDPRPTASWKDGQVEGDLVASPARSFDQLGQPVGGGRRFLGRRIQVRDVQPGAGSLARRDGLLQR